MGVNPMGGGVKREWYPSGPRLDGKRSSDDYSYSSPTVDVNPNPDKWEIHDAVQVGKALVVKIKYPNCINYEGVKILVFKEMTLFGLIKQKKIDPHFFQDKKYVSPIARFEPTDFGWDLALKVAELIK